jgi:hypothetical protein
MHDSQKTTVSPRSLLLVGMIVLAAVVAAGMRLVPYAFAGQPVQDYLWNFTPVLAMLLFGLTYVRSPWVGYLLPLTAMTVSDVVLQATGWGESTVAARVTIYVAFVLAATPGLWLRRSFSVTNLAAATLIGSVLFFLVSNGEAWLNPVLGYPTTLTGLAEAYRNGLPFFRNQLLGDFFFVGVLFGAWAVAVKYLPAARPAAQPEPVLAA